jgi:FtsP/CotA-like multicopper oxidase with cupredoxin domain
MVTKIYIALLIIVLLATSLIETVPTSRADQPGQMNRLDPMSIPKFVEPLVIPPVMEPVGVGEDGVVEYEIAVRQFEQQVLPAGFPKTTVFGYGKAGDPLPGGSVSSSFNYPAFTIEARTNEKVRVTWFNHLVDIPSSGRPQFLPHLLPVDQTLHWANPGGGGAMRGQTQESYRGPVPIIVHLHGGHTPPHSDGYPEAWYLPAASNIPDDFMLQGQHYATVQEAPPGAAVFEYPNDQRATTLWYHDHALGMTRLNVYAGMAGFYLLRDETEESLNLPGPAPKLGDAPDTAYYEIPIVIQDRSFYEDGSLFYPDSRTFFDEYPGPYFPEGVVPPIWNPEFFGDSIVVNGRTWPYLEVEPALYRFRLLNGSNSRFLLLKADADLTFNVIGTDGGLLPDQPLALDQLLMGPAERFDVLVDFSAFQPGDTITLLNLGPDEPFGGLPIETPANPDTTGQIMQFRIKEASGDTRMAEIPAALPPIERLVTDLPERFVTLNEEMTDEENMDDAVPVAAVLGTPAEGPLGWHMDITENPMTGDVEMWSITNLTGDAHPIHVHLVMFQVVERIPFDTDAFHEAQETYLLGRRAGDPPSPLDFVTGDPISPNAWEMGWKDTVIANPGEITRIIARFDQEGLYVWHCHILEHEDNEMMRPFYVGALPE